VPGLLFAIALFWLTRRFSHPLLIPGCFAVAMALFYGGLAATGTSVQAALDQGWMLGPFPSGGGCQPFGPLQWSQANWPVVLAQLPSIATLVMITALSLLLVSTGIELATEQDLDLNRELKSVGVASLLSGLGGGMVGSHAVTTLLVSNMGVRSRAVGIFASLLYLAVLLFGLSMLSYFPRFMIGGALLFIGLQLLYQWVVASWARLPRLDYGLIWLILIIVALKDFLTGVGVGLLIASLLFILSYGRQRVVKYVRSGAAYQSHAARSLPLMMQLHDVFPDEAQASEFSAYLETRDVAAGTVLFRAGDRANGLHWIESGQATLWIDLHGDQQKRLQTLGQGMIVGEDACYPDAVHTVMAIADVPSALHWLSADALSNLRQQNPQLTLRLMDWVMRLLSEQVIHAKAEIQELLQ
jgi:MFS superfamily sulfate permease-like transporter